MLSQIKLLLAMCWFEAQRFRAYPLEIVGGLGSRLAELALFITFWLIVGRFSANGAIRPLDVISYYMIITGFMPFFYLGFGIAGTTIEMIKNGELSQVLIKPVNPLLYPWAQRTGQNLINVLFGLLQISIGMYISGGIKPHAWQFLVPVVLNMALLNAAFNIAIGTLGFYMIEARPLKNSLLVLISFLRGERMPIFLMPANVVGFLMLTPFPASQYHLAILLQGTRLPLWHDVWVGTAWGVTLFLASLWLWKRGLRRYEAVGI
ncbi:MAG TPA: ABC-2 family transporter protein [Patescibacteria group bacterium]|jgi:ABC-2 type transport system permease protein|nr:ABC-2 family transporter protein [Patescibacteria group bacterium]